MLAVLWSTALDVRFVPLERTLRISIAKYSQHSSGKGLTARYFAAKDMDKFFSLGRNLKWADWRAPTAYGPRRGTVRVRGSCLPGIERAHQKVHPGTYNLAT